MEHRSSSPGWPVPIPVNRLLKVQLVHIGTFSEDDRSWRQSLPIVMGIHEAMCPGIRKAVGPTVGFSVWFAASPEESIEAVSQMMDQLGSDVMTQEGWAIFGHPTRGKVRCEFRLAYHLRNESGEVPGKVTLVELQHPLFPKQ